MNNLAKRLQAAPFVPTIRSDEDLSNFEFSREDDGDNSQANHEGIGLKPLTKEQQQLFALLTIRSYSDEPFRSSIAQAAIFA